MSTLRSIAVGYDGSVESETAVRWSAHLAHETNATLSVVHATGLLERLGFAFKENVVPTAVSEIITQSGLDEAHFRWLVDEGDACSVLIRCAGAPVSADLLVVGSRGQGKRAGMMIGSVSLELVQHAVTPVVVVPATFVEP
jgi:nucleotide-binding universal stress UspA family protein